MYDVAVDSSKGLKLLKNLQTKSGHKSSLRLQGNGLMYLLHQDVSLVNNKINCKSVLISILIESRDVAEFLLRETYILFLYVSPRLYTYGLLNPQHSSTDSFSWI